MDEFIGGGDSGSSNSQGTLIQKDLGQFGSSSGGDAVFDASQYAFFGNNVVQDIELGGLEDEDEGIPPVGFEEDEYHLDQEEGEGGVDDLSSTFSKLNKAVSRPRNGGLFGDGATRESSSATEWAREGDFSNWFDHPIVDAESSQESKRWLSQPPASAAPRGDLKLLHRTSSYPEQQPQPLPRHHLFSSEPILGPKSSFTSFPLPGKSQQPLSNLQSPLHPNTLFPFGGHRVVPSPPNVSPLSNSHLPVTNLPHRLQFAGNLPQICGPLGLPVNNQMQNMWVDHSSFFPGDRTNSSNEIYQQQLLSNQNGLVPPHILSQQQPQQHRLQAPLQSQFGHLLGMHPQMMDPHLSPDFHGLAGLRDQRFKILPKSRQPMRQQGPDIGNQRSESMWLQFRSKYMTADEIESIVRMQIAATYSSDPYVDDYYHQACLANKSSGAKLRFHFCPNSLRDYPSRARANNEPHPFLQVDALGRVSFSSIRRPRPLLEMDPPDSSSSGSPDHKLSERSLQQEPMLATRVTIEDGACLLLDVDDIDRFLQFNQFEDGGAQLRRRRQVLLEGLAVSLQLVDPLGKDGHTVDLTPKDDLVFLRLASLPKGRKLLSRFLQLLVPGDEIARVVCMAIFRHLRFLFAALPADPGAAEMTHRLETNTLSSVSGMDLRALGACLASVVCSSEHPPLRPIGSSSGNGASLLLKSILDRATKLLTDAQTHGQCSTSDRVLWQASFDAFFGLLTKYCFSKYDAVVESLVVQAGSSDTIESDAAKAIRRDMPVELLRASLPHTNEHQRKLLVDFAHRSMPVLGDNNNNGSTGSSAP